MGKKEKLIERLKSKPKDFTFDEMKTLLELLGLEMSNKGKTSGSRVKFTSGNIPIYLHKPHPRKELLEYQIKYILDALEKEGLI
ncbi:MAG: type II toxin-antitoxin system HicA family toxin [Oscillospiraceae bacterium]|nr:type II toxin-antitoxin system HicA family toxin [Oscillospiraceae bacterium]